MHFDIFNITLRGTIVLILVYLFYVGCFALCRVRFILFKKNVCVIA